MIRVAFVFSELGSNWLGGVNYYRSLLSALRDWPDPQIEPIIFVGDSPPQNIERIFCDWKMIRTSLLNQSGMHQLMRRLIRKAFGRDLLLYRLLRRHHIDVLSHYAHMGRFSRIPVVGWIADFQHLHLKQFFSRKELKLRDREYRITCRSSDILLLSSQAALQDLVRFEPSAQTKARVLNFVPELNPSGPFGARAELEDRYGFKGPYFYLPNQFWVHKNHKIVIDALARLKERWPNIMVIATGNKSDPRCPDHFESLLIRIRETGTAENFKILGMIPYGELLSFMEHAIAVINPSLFEGWSTTVEEAKALEKIVILSDIPVHREQRPKRGMFFNPLDADSLLRAMTEVMLQASAASGVEKADTTTYWASRAAFATNYQGIVRNLMRLL